MPSPFQGQWIVCVRDIQSGDDDYLGPFRSKDKADAVAKRLNRNIIAVGAPHVLDAIVEWVQPGLDVEQYRDDMLGKLAAWGYTKETYDA